MFNVSDNWKCPPFEKYYILSPKFGNKLICVYETNILNNFYSSWFRPTSMEKSKVNFNAVTHFLLYRYGDKAPRSFSARLFGVFWILVGLVIISTFTATITTVLTTTTLTSETKLYGTKVGALNNSEEFRLGVKRNAHIVGEMKFKHFIKNKNCIQLPLNKYPRQRRS